MDYIIDWFINRCYLNLFFEDGVFSIVLYEEEEEALNPEKLLWCYGDLNETTNKT